MAHVVKGQPCRDGPQFDNHNYYRTGEAARQRNLEQLLAEIADWLDPPAA